MALNPGLDALNQGLTRYYVHMRRDGTVEKLEPCDNQWSKYEIRWRFMRL